MRLWLECVLYHLALWDIEDISRIFDKNQKLFAGLYSNARVKIDNHADTFPPGISSTTIRGASMGKLSSGKRFRIAFSFPGECKDIIKGIVDKLTKTFSAKEILYDEFHKAEFARPNLDLHLQNLYHNESELIVVALCPEYDQKEWCGIEWRAIRDFVNKDCENIMFLKTGDVQVSGIFNFDGYIDVKQQGIAESAALIIERYNML